MDNKLTPEKIIKLLNLEPLPEEGGFYREIYRSDETLKNEHLPTRYTGEKTFGTAIYYLLTPEEFSGMHRILSDEVFHFYLGDPVSLLQLYPDGSSEVMTVGQDIVNEQKPQVTVARNTWQGAFLNEGGRFALMGTTVAPAFDFSDFETGNRETLIEKYPDRKELIIKLTR
ncbi:MAG: cupin domain-containing protein [bacterium]|nr:cupin domain-containing protein [bacterium]